MNKTRSAGCIIALPMLMSCNKSAELAPQLIDRVKADVLRTYVGPMGPKAIKLIAAWHAGADPQSKIICGKFEAPPPLRNYRATLRFVDDLTGGYAQVEYHELWAGGAIGTQLVDANRSLFNDIWAEHCEPYSP